MLGSVEALAGRRGMRRHAQIWSVWKWLLVLGARDEASGEASAGDAAGNTAERGALPGPREQVDLLYQAHARAVLGYLAHRLPSLADAEDALAEVFLAVLGACVEGEEPGVGWLMTIARRRVADFYRERGRLGRRGESGNSAALADAVDMGMQPEQLSLRSEQQRELLALVARLPEEQREALALRFAAGLRSSQIAAILGKSEEATRALLSRAVRRLRKEWVR